MSSSTFQCRSLFVLAVVFALFMLLIPMPFHSIFFRNGFMVDYDEVAYNIPFHKLIQESEWHWDHNVYQSRQQEESWFDPERRPIPEPRNVSWNTEAPASPNPSMGRNLVIAQFVGGVSQTSPRRRKGKAISPELQQQILSNVADVTSRPNRAYARQWGRNFVRFQLWDDFSIAASLFLKVIRDRQEEQASLQYENECILPYDAIALLLPGAVIMDLDYDLVELIPTDKLLAIGGNGVPHYTNNGTVTNGIILLNLQHDRANQLIDRWWNELESSYAQHFSDRAASSDETMYRLIQIIESMLLDGEDIKSLVFYLEEADLGFVLEAPYSMPDIQINSTRDVSSSAFCIKSFASTTMDDSRVRNADASTTLQLLTNPQGTMTTLQTTADAVCYRYYPKCEVL